MSSLFFAIIIIAILLAFAGVAFFLNRKFLQLAEAGKQDQVLMEWLKGMRESLDKTTETVNRQLFENSKTLNIQLAESNKTINERLDRAAQVIGAVQKELGTMSEVGKTMKDLQDFLLSPKLRGGVGEQVLKDLLEQILPRENFSLQYRFKDGQVVDAIIKTDRGLIPIDSKFPIENFKRQMEAQNEEEKTKFQRLFARDVIKHVDDIAKKYILPAEGTVDFAVMYIPSESVYYDIVVNGSDLNRYAQGKKVLFVSPNNFYYFLRILLMAMQEKKVAESAQRILETLESIRQEAGKFGENLGVLAGHITRAKNCMDTVSSQFQLLDGRIESVRMLEGEHPPAPPELTFHTPEV